MKSVTFAHLVMKSRQITADYINVNSVHWCENRKKHVTILAETFIRGVLVFGRSEKLMTILIERFRNQVVKTVYKYKKIMMKPGIQPKVDTRHFQPGVVIAAEIVFAALLLYLTNHPVNLDESTLADNSAGEPPVVFENQTTNVAVASTAISTINRLPLK